MPYGGMVGCTLCTVRVGGSKYEQERHDAGAWQ